MRKKVLLAARKIRSTEKRMTPCFGFFFSLCPAGTAPSGVIVSVLSVITVLCLLILLLFCYKDKLKLLSGRLDTSITPRGANASVATLFNPPSGSGVSTNRRIQPSSDMLAGTICFYFIIVSFWPPYALVFSALSVSASLQSIKCEFEIAAAVSTDTATQVENGSNAHLNCPLGKRTDIYTLRSCTLDPD